MFHNPAITLANASNPENKAMSAVAFKATADTKLGITLNKTGDRILICHIQPDSPFRATPLRQGMTLLKINQEDVSRATLMYARNLLCNAVGNVELWAKWGGHALVGPTPQQPYDDAFRRTILVAALMKSPESPAGVGLVRGLSETYQVSSIDPDGPFANTDLRIGMTVTSINGIEISYRNEGHVATAMKSTTAGYTIFALETSEPFTTKYVMAKAVRESLKDKFGIGLLKVPTAQRDVLVVSKIAENSPFQSSDLKVGMRVRKINNVDVTSKDIQAATRLLQSAKTDLTIHAATQEYSVPSTPATHALETTSVLPATSAGIPAAAEQEYSAQTNTATVIKISQGIGLGISLGRDAAGNIWVTALSSESLFRPTSLPVGAKVLSINGAQITGKQLPFVQELLKCIVGRVVLDYLSNTPSPAAPVESQEDEGDWC